MATPDVRPAGDLPDAIGKTAGCMLPALHGVELKAIRLLPSAT